MHGIEAAYLTDSISHRGILQRGSNGEVLQLVEDKIQLVTALGIIDPDEGLTERLPLEIVRQALSLCTDGAEA
jgi:DNA phosphorothioation-dependent restriction protein DptG